MNMIERLRRKFIIMATIGVLVVLGGAWASSIPSPICG